jgi:rhamnose utilization protein RhaD (predicted bifunctional aldolase and dehydrogenase)
VIAIAACKPTARHLTREDLRGELGWLPWQRPGYDLGLKLEAVAVAAGLRGIILEGHGLFTWGDTAKSCYEVTLAIIKRAEDWLAANSKRLRIRRRQKVRRPAGSAPRWRSA